MMNIVAALVTHNNIYHSGMGGAVRCKSNPKPRDEGKRGGCQEASPEFDTKDDDVPMSLIGLVSLTVPAIGKNPPLPLRELE